ncbi:MAG TPA: di-heme oxidoredictase family protein [Polyangia bacterium]|nr:di-heme oxidoredictase family protein [Polyangia bacterium]
MSAPRSLSQVFARGGLVGLLALGACTGETMGPGSTGNGQTGNNNAGQTDNGTPGSTNNNPSGNGGTGVVNTMPGDGTGTTTNPGDGTGTTTTPPPYTGNGMPPSDSCNGSLPGSYVTLCSACHNQAGQANSRYPDLYKFMGTEDAFAAQVRNGGKEMAAYSTALISDGDISAIYRYFTGANGQRPTLDSVQLNGVMPLYSATDAMVNGPIVIHKDDGSIWTRGAGRVRGRHEKEGSFGQFLENYFDNRTYGFIVQDYTNTATKHIKTTYEPVSTPDHNGNRITNWRHWKMQGDNATFMQNDYMKDGTMADAPMPPTGKTAFVQYFDDVNPPGGRTFTQGQNFEFEFGIFITPSELVTPGSRDSYYTDTFRYQIGIGGLTPYNMDYDNGMAPFNAMGPIPDARFGGDTTASWLRIEPYNYYGEMALNMQQENVQNFVGGRRLFHTDFATGAHSDPGNPALTTVAGFAGPVNNTNSCESCHFRNGPGFQLTGALDSKSSMVFKFPGAKGQLHQQTGSVTVGAQVTKTVMLSDGTSVTLSKPAYSVTTMAGGAQAFSARIARKLVGMGLLEAIDERTLLTRADRLDCNKDGISGRPLYVSDPQNGALRIGRFGWKAEKVSVKHQVADALVNDIDVGTSIFKDSAGKAELSDADLAKITTYMSLLSVPPQQNANDPDVQKGAQIFKTVGCANCHMTDAITGANHPFTELRNQSIKPYSDLLLHDMGPDLADNSGIQAPSDTDTSSTAALAPAGASEWRTAPLWGIGLLTTVDPMGRATSLGLLHDGRAKSPLEAVLWHGGEAEKVKAAFIALPAADRAALLKFLANI